MEHGQWTEAKEGSPQGAVISPILANLYLHYALDQWVQAWRNRRVDQEMIVVRYADDAVLGFRTREDAEEFLEQLRERLLKFGLELHPEKTRWIEFGRYAAERRKKRGQGNRRRSIFWDSPISAEPIRRVISRYIARPSANGWRPSSSRLRRRCANECTRVRRHW